MNDAGTMKTYVAEINGEAVIAFRAMGDDDAQDMVGDEDDELDQARYSRNGEHCRARCHRSDNPCDFKICGGIWRAVQGNEDLLGMGDRATAGRRESKLGH
jgi:hypothetical protein